MTDNGRYCHSAVKCHLIVFLLISWVMLCFRLHVVESTVNKNKDYKTWQYLSRLDNSLVPMKVPTIEGIQNPKSQDLEVLVSINTTLLQVSVNNAEIYSMEGGKVEMGHRWQHSGVHLIVLSTKDTIKRSSRSKGTFGSHRAPGGQETSGTLRVPRVALTQRFITYQPAESLDLVTILENVRPGKIVIIAAVPEWLMFLGKRGEQAFKKLGFQYHVKTANGEPWLGIATSDGRVYMEHVVTTTHNIYPANALHFECQIEVDDLQDSPCKWHTNEEMREQAEFCSLYEGYGDLCDCRKPFTHLVRLQQPSVIMTEKIPVVVVTANKPRRLYRLLRNLFTVPGTAETDIFTVIDGYHPETIHLLEVLKIDYAIHRPEGFHNVRTNSNIRFALYSVFRRYPDVDKAIVLEDDLILSPDVLRFFHQTSWILNNDPTVFCVNAFNSNSLKGTASDTTKLLRSESFPMYGWMVRRQYALQVITHWIPGEEGDWDWYLMRASSQRGRDVVSPEVSRTFHAGSAGAHVDGFEQHLYYNRMIATTDANTFLKDLRGVTLENYMESLRKDIQRSEMLTPDPTEEDFLPKGHHGPFIIFVRAGTRNDEFYSFRVFMMSLKTYYWDTREIFRGVMRFNIKGRILYVVGCPLSQDFCHYNPKGHMNIRPTKDLILQVRRANNLFEGGLCETTIKRRAIHRDPGKVASLENIY